MQINNISIFIFIMLISLSSFTNNLGIDCHKAFPDDFFKVKPPRLFVEKNTDVLDNEKSIGESSTLVRLSHPSFSFISTYLTENNAAFFIIKAYGLTIIFIF